MKTAYIIDAVRTPIGKYGGALSKTRPDDLAALVIKSIIERNPEIPLDKIEDVILGCTGARIITTLVHEMSRRENVRYGLAILCISVGQGVAMIFEKM